MAGFYGADVDQLKQLSRDFAQQADEINAIIARLSGKVSTAVWRGPDSERFRGDWGQSMLPALRAAVEQLQTASRSAQTNAQQQEQASGGAGAAGMGHGSGTSMDVEVPSELVGRPPASQWWDGVTAQDIFERSGEFLDSKATGLPWTWGDLGELLPKVGSVLEVRDYADRIAHGEFPLHEMIGTVAGELRTSPNPVTYLVGAAISTWDSTIQQAMKTDWSIQTFNSNMDFVSNNPWDAASAAAEAVVEYIPNIIKDLKFW